MVITQQVLIGNCAEILQTLPSESVDCVVTSPPYWGLRDYKTEPQVWGGCSDCEHDWTPEGVKRYDARRDHDGKDFGDTRGQEPTRSALDIELDLGATCHMCGAWRGQLGLEPTPQLYIEHLTAIFEEVKRVLKEDGTCWVNLGDTYSGSLGNYGSRDGGQREVATEQKSRRGSFSESFLPPASRCGIREKSLVQIPSRFAIAMIDAGWILRNEIIWHKPNCMPSSVKDRFTVDFEKMFFFVKSKRYYFEPQKESLAVSTLENLKCYNGEGRYTFNGKRPENTPLINQSFKAFDLSGRNKRTVWTISTKPYEGAHFAVFPPELVETPIRAGCPPGGVVLDPFGGSGTTSEVARKLSRSSIIIELNPDYLELIRERARTDVPDVLGFGEVTP
jgi:site-specific DNA-methyltransferase (cytosine-N4-specific)